MAGDEQVAAAAQRPLLATAVALAHVAVGVCWVAIVVFLVYLTRSPEILKGKDAAEAVHGLKIGALVLAPVPIPFLIGGLGLWKGRVWGWVVGVATDAAASILFVWDAFDQRHIAWDDAVVGVIFPVLLIVLMLGPVRRWCWRRSGLRSRASGVAG